MRAIFFQISALSAVLGSMAIAASPSAIEAELKRRAEQKKAAEATPPAKADDVIIPHQEKARQVAETVYNTWRLSMIRGNEQAWRASTCRSRQMKVRNLIISQRGEFPRDFFRETQEAPNIDNFVYVGSLLGCKGHTMACTYVGKLQLGDGTPKENAFVLELVLEQGKWKLDQTRFFDLSQLPDVRKRLYNKDLNLLKEQDGFMPYDRIPGVPLACKAPELIGKVFVDCPGRQIEMTINGISVHEFDDERRADVISGGLKRGQNTITYKIKDREGLKRPTMAIGLFVAPETPGNRGVCVFDHILDAQDKANGGSFTFNISNEHIASMNPRFKGEQPAPHHAVPLKQKSKK